LLAFALAGILLVYWQGVRQPRWTLRGHRRLVASLVFSRDGKTLVSGGWDGAVGLWDVTEGALRSLSSDDVPPATYEGGPLPSATATEMRARVVADIGRYFTDRLQARYEPMILDAVDQIGASEWDAQVDRRYDWGGARVDGDRATVHLTETKSILRRGGQFGIGRTETHRLDTTGDWTISLVRSAGAWRVNEIDVNCRTGCP
jgi:hypothetical protein